MSISSVRYWAAYGETTVAALKKGATVIVNDIDEGSLKYIIKRKELNDDDRKRLYLKKVCSF